MVAVWTDGSLTSPSISIATDGFRYSASCQMPFYPDCFKIWLLDDKLIGIFAGQNNITVFTRLVDVSGIYTCGYSNNDGILMLSNRVRYVKHPRGELM